MATVHTPTDSVELAREATTENYFNHALAALRIAFGLTFLWAFFDKLLALGFHTGYDQEGNLDRFGAAAWINGGSPTEGFLKFGADGPFKGFYNSIGGTPWLDALFMLSLLGVGIGLTFGIGMRIAGAARRAHVRLDVDRGASPGEPPVPRRAHPRRDQHGGLGPWPRRPDLGLRQAVGRHLTGSL